MHIWEMLHIEQGIKYIGISTEKTLEENIKLIVKLSQNIIKGFYYKKISTFPSVRRDLSLLLDSKVDSEDIIKYIFDCSDNLLKKANVFDVYTGKELGKDSKSLAIALIFQSDQKTLVDKEVDERISSILNKIKTKFGAIQR